MALRLLRHFAWLAVTVLPIGAFAQTSPGGQPEPTPAAPSPEAAEHVLEAYPSDVAKKLAAHYRKTRELTVGMRGLYSSIDIWPHNVKTLQICFIGGSAKLRAKVVKSAREWTRLGAHVPFDFGRAGQFLECQKTSAAHIRISFRRGSIWSLIGQQSINRSLVGPQQPSMNLGFSPRTNSRRIRRIVLHEFGHALGLEHEHQHPFTKCWDAEYDKKKLLAYLRAQRGWSRRVSQSQLKIIRRQGTMATSRDKHSIMLYSFPKQFYRKRDKSPCFAPERFEISAADTRLIRGIYPPQFKSRAEQQRERRRRLLAKLKQRRRLKNRSVDDKKLDHALEKQLNQLVPEVR